MVAEKKRDSLTVASLAALSGFLTLVVVMLLGMLAGPAPAWEYLFLAVGAVCVGLVFLWLLCWLKAGWDRKLSADSLVFIWFLVFLADKTLRAVQGAGARPVHFPMVAWHVDIAAAVILVVIRGCYVWLIRRKGAEGREDSGLVDVPD